MKKTKIFDRSDYVQRASVGHFVTFMARILMQKEAERKVLEITITLSLVMRKPDAPDSHDSQTLYLLFSRQEGHVIACFKDSSYSKHIKKLALGCDGMWERYVLQAVNNVAKRLSIRHLRSKGWVAEEPSYSCQFYTGSLKQHAYGNPQRARGSQRTHQTLPTTPKKTIKSRRPRKKHMKHIPKQKQ